MALRVDIPLSAKTANPLAAIKAGQNVLIGDQNLKAGEQQQRMRELQIDKASQDMVTQSMVDGALQLNEFLKAGDIEGGARALQGRIQSLTARGRDPSDSMNALERLQQGDIEGVQNDINSILAIGQQRGILKPSAREVFSATTVNMPGGLTVQTTNAGRKFVTDVTGRELQGDEARKAVVAAEQREIETLRAKSTVDVEEARQREDIKQTAKRSSDFISEISERNRNAARDQRRIREAVQLSNQAGEGLTAAAKVKLARLFPGIDIQDEAALDSSLTQIALDQLQNFKGPTTDFEFGVTRDISGQFSDPRDARNARLKALERATWFNQREFDQFQKHQRSGGTADNFRFNFGEQVSTKKGNYTLEDLQDTAVANHISIDEVLQRLNK